MKNIFIVIVIIALGVLGYLFFKQGPEEAGVPNTPNTEENNSISGKLDINVVCEGALSYMTFSSGAEADAFVADCKAGNRPEVVERYKADMNLGAGATI